ncbi:hypothetical protein A2U01_0102952, partial [Trifolium medium]|nr:hypothetical protein [Trifolium medium]
LDLSGLDIQFHHLDSPMLPRLDSSALPLDSPALFHLNSPVFPHLDTSALPTSILRRFRSTLRPSPAISHYVG